LKKNARIMKFDHCILCKRKIFSSEEEQKEIKREEKVYSRAQ